MKENKDLINGSEIESLIDDIDFAPTIDEDRVLSDEDKEETKIEESED